MTTKKKAIWWIYAVATCLLWIFVAPALISARDDLFAIAGVVLLVLWVVWSWNLWIKTLINKAKAYSNEI